MHKIHTIQYLRALAALAVVALHASNRVGADLPAGAGGWFGLGHAGVDLFFVISGFIMWSIGRDTRHGPAGFMLRRAIRVAPPYWIATLTWVLLAAGAGLSWVDLSAPHVLKSLAFVPHYNPEFPDRIWPVLVPGWTLSYEMFFYLVFACALALSAVWRLPALVAALLLLTLAGVVLGPERAWLVVYTSPLLLEFLGGCLVAELWRRAPGGAGRNLLVTGLGVVLLLVLGPGVSSEDLWARTLGFGLPAILLVSGCAGLDRHLRPVALPERLGDASYAIYLFHIPVLTLVHAFWARLPGTEGTGAALGFVVLFLVLMSGIGLWLFRYLERPMQRRLNGLLLPRPGGLNLARR